MVHNKNQLLNQYISKLQLELSICMSAVCKDWQHPLHKRMKNTFYLIKDGTGEIVVNGIVLHPKAGDMVFLPKNAQVSLYTPHENCYEKYWCEFEAYFESINLFEILEIPYCIKVSNFDKIQTLFEKLQLLSEKEDIISALHLKAVLLEIIAFYLEEANDNILFKMDDFSKTVFKYIDENIEKDISVDTLANLVHFHPKYFIKVFKQRVGITPIHYLKTVRIEKSKTLLSCTEQSVGEIAKTVGYTNAKNFSSDFKKITGYLPTEYRKHLKEIRLYKIIT
ncbi:MAG: AraC family transcriptional regulator [Clostridia bacterium]|nr:AraC family transcriptional regulator [Clostridia bacterium]